MSEQASFVRNESRSGELLLYLMRRWLLLAPSQTTVKRSATAIMETDGKFKNSSYQRRRLRETKLV